MESVVVLCLTGIVLGMVGGRRVTRRFMVRRGETAGTAGAGA